MELFKLLVGFKKVMRRVGLMSPADKEELEAEMKLRIAAYRRLGMKIGEGCYIAAVNFGQGGKDPIVVGNDCVLTNCTILGHDASPAAFIRELRGKGGLLDRISLFRSTEIKDNCFIGFNATILCGVTVGPRSIVGAGAVVTRDVPPGMVVAGNPAEVISTVEAFIEKHLLQMSAHPEWYPGLTMKKPTSFG